MYGSLFWIEWLDRLDRVLNGAREDVAALNRAASPRGLASLERSRRQLSALSNDLRLLDRKVLSAGLDARTDVTADLQGALDTVLLRLEGLSEAQSPNTLVMGERVLAGIDAALRDSRYEAARLIEPKRRLA